eukprot:jgi/Tetstr1/454250/TSEL_041169.t1
MAKRNSGSMRRGRNLGVRRGNRCPGPNCRNPKPEHDNIYCFDCRHATATRLNPNIGDADANSTCLVCCDELNARTDIHKCDCGHLVHMECFRNMSQNSVTEATKQCPYGTHCYLWVRTRGTQDD